MRDTHRLRLWIALALLLIGFSPSGANAQTSPSSEAGLPYFVQQFSPHANPQNWSVVQDSAGVIYVANNDGILLYDGVSWNLIRTESQAIVRSLAVGPEGRVYVGQVGDLGVLMPDSTGSLQFESLTEEIPPAQRTFDDVWTTTVTSDGVYFQTSSRLFRWNGSAMRSWQGPGEFHTAFAVRDTFYVSIRDKGLHRMVDNSLQLVPGGDRLRGLHLFMMSAHERNQTLIGTRQEGLFLKTNAGIEHVSSEITSLLRERRAYHGRKIADNVYAVATLGGGVLLITATGELIDVLTDDYELPGNVVNYVYPDRQGGLWLALHNQGIVRVDVPTPLTVFKGEIGPEGLSYSIRRHEGTLYTATGSGLFYLDEEPLLQNGVRGQSRFRRIPGIPSAWSLLSMENILLIASQDGIYALENADETPRLLSDRRTFTLRSDQAQPNRVLAGTKSGLLSLTRTAAGWQSEPFGAEITEEIRSIVQASRDTLWLATQYASEGRVMRLTVDRSDSTRYHIRRFGQKAGLPVGDIRVSSMGERPLFTASEGMYRFNRTREQFVRRSPVPKQAETDSLRSVAERENGRLWMVYPRHVEIATPTGDGGYTISRPTNLRIPYSPYAQLYVESSSIVWISGDHELIRYDPAVEKDHEYTGRALIRNVRSLETGALMLGAGQLYNEGENQRHILPYEQNNLQVEVGAPFYDRPDATTFQFHLAGANDNWSEWQREPTYAFAGLDPGSYELRVRARSIHGIVSEPATMSFRILPPWYRTWMAYIGYAIIAGLATVITVRYRRLVLEQRKAEEQRRELEREREINERLQAANERLQEANEWKDSLVANTSHELRTPLAAILGFARVLKDEVTGHHEEFVDLIEANGKRLQHTIDRLLDMSKLEAGEISVHTSKFDITACTHRVVESLRPLAEEKELNLKIDIPAGPIDVQLDKNKVEEIVYNLTGNAIKFTEEGFLRVAVEACDDQIRLTVEDSGIGMSDEFISEMFDSFTQESRGLERTHEGTGLGLFITARLVDLMEGDIHVDSTKGEGTTFRVTLERQLSVN